MLDFQVHHIFPKTMMKDFKREFDALGIKIEAEDYSNRINLFSNQEMADVMQAFYDKKPDEMSIARFFGSVRHSGGHDVYTKFVEATLKDILAEKTSPEAKQALVLDLHQQLVIAMREGFPPLHNTSLADYEAHFQDKLATIAELTDANGVYDANTTKNQQILNYQSEYNKYNITNLDNTQSAKQDFEVIKQLIDEKYGSIDNLPNPPYLQSTINEIKLKMNGAGNGDLRQLIGILVYDDINKSTRKVRAGNIYAI